MRLRWYLMFVFLVLTKSAFADPDPSRFIIVVSPLSFGSPSSGSVVVTFGSGGIILPGAIITSKPLITSRPTVIVPSGYFLVQFRSGNWTVVWCEPLRTNVIILGRPLIRPVPWSVPSPLFVPPLFFDPSVMYGVPQVWHSPLLQPGTMVFRLKHRSAEEVAKVLNEARVLPDGQFVGIGNILVVSAPSLSTSGVQQSRIRDLIAAIDQPSEGTKTSAPPQSQTRWKVEVYSAHSATCSAHKELPSDRSALLKLSGYSCLHRLGETEWNPTSQGDVVIKGEKVDARLQAKRNSIGWQFALKGQLNGKSIDFEGQSPDTSQPILIVAPTTDQNEGLVLVLMPKP